MCYNDIDNVLLFCCISTVYIIIIVVCIYYICILTVLFNEEILKLRWENFVKRH